MKNSDRAGSYIVASTAGESYKAFIPHPLPPNPPLQFDAEHHELIEKANLSLGRLDGLTTFLPDTSMFLYYYVRKEAVLSSQIEGTQSSLSDLLLYENHEVPGVPLDDVVEVSQYVAAMDYGLKRLKSDFPLSLRLIREIHGVLLSKGRGSTKTPGEFRRSQNWIGGSRPGTARFVPPPPDKVMECMGALEKFFHEERMPVLIKAALSHVQFETIHPFLDGNGRVGRLLITLLFCSHNVLREPMLYLSLYFKKNRLQYYDLLQRVRTEGDWEGWLRFFLTGVHETAEQAAHACQSIMRVFDADRHKIEKLGRPAISVLRVHQMLQRKPILSALSGAKETGLTRQTVLTALKQLQKIKIVRELTGKERDRLFVYDDYLKILSEGTEPIKPGEG